MSTSIRRPRRRIASPAAPTSCPKSCIAYELGYRAQVDPRLALSISTFYNDYTNLRSLEPLKPPAAFPVERSSGLIGHSTGAELTAEWRVAPVVAAARRLDGAARPHRAAARLPIGAPAGAFPAIRTTSSACAPRWTCPRNGSGTPTVRYVGPITNQGVPGYAEMDLRLGWQPDPAWEFSVVGQNLLHAHHPEFNPPGSRREIQRSVYGKTSWRF